MKITRLVVLSAMLTLLSSAAVGQGKPAGKDVVLYFVWPQNGATIKGAFWCRFGLRNMGITHAGDDFQNSGHQHLLIDVNDPLDPNEPIPQDKNHLHFGAGQTETRLELPPGKHTLQLVLGDARLTLDRNSLAEHERYGVLIVDAFSSDAIPMHLINREALRMFLNKITKDGIICFHISNRHLDLEPVLANLCQDAGLIGYLMSDNNENYAGKSASTWVAIARKEEDLARLMTATRWKHEQAGAEHELRARRGQIEYRAHRDRRRHCRIDQGCLCGARGPHSAEPALRVRQFRDRP